MTSGVIIEKVNSINIASKYKKVKHNIKSIGIEGKMCLNQHH